MKHLNSYVFLSREQNLIVDTGFNHVVCREAMLKGLKQLNVDLMKTDFFITHLHADHFDLVSTLAADKSAVYIHTNEAVTIQQWTGWGAIMNFAANHGYPEKDISETMDRLPVFDAQNKFIQPKLVSLKDGDLLDVGDYHFTCIHTPGHTIGHLCLYETEKKLLIAGDHLLTDITPNIQCWAEEQNPLAMYIASLDRIYDLPIDLVLPGHRRFITNHKKRIVQLKTHHEQRCLEILEIIKNEAFSGFQIASRMTWDIRADSWESFPLLQKLFAFSETMAHLKYLEEKKRISCHTQRGVCRFSLNQ